MRERERGGRARAREREREREREENSSRCVAARGGFARLPGDCYNGKVYISAPPGYDVRLNHETKETKMIMMSFIFSCRNKIGAELLIYLEEGTYHKRLFRGPSTNDIESGSH